MVYPSQLIRKLALFVLMLKTQEMFSNNEHIRFLFIAIISSNSSGKAGRPGTAGLHWRQPEGEFHQVRRRKRLANLLVQLGNHGNSARRELGHLLQPGAGMHQVRRPAAAAVGNALGAPRRLAVWLRDRLQRVDLLRLHRHPGRQEFNTAVFGIVTEEVLRFSTVGISNTYSTTTTSTYR